MDISDILDNAAGKAQNTQGESLITFLASLTTSATILVLGTTLYALLKARLPQVYSRPTAQIRQLRWNPVPLSWPILFSPMPDPSLTHASGFENYLFDRYLHTIVRIFLLLCLAILPILLPLNIVNGRNQAGGVRGLDRLSFLNLRPSHSDRYWAHLVLGVLTAAIVCWILRRELHDYHRLRQKQSASAWDDIEGLSTLLVVSDSKEQISTKGIRRLFRNVAGGVRRVTVNRDYSTLRAKLRARDVTVERLEVAETELIRKATRLRRKRSVRNERGPLWRRCLAPTDRPSFRQPIRPWLPPLPGIGPRVDSIYEYRSRIARLNREISWAQEHPNKFPETNSALVCFNGQIPLPVAALALRTQVPRSWMLKRGAIPNDMIWHNAAIGWWQQLVRTAIVYVLITALTLGFAAPVTVAGSLSQVRYLADVVPWLQWTSELPPWLMAVIEGVLPQLMVSLVTYMVPTAIRLFTDIQGLHSRQATENHVQIYYFTFLFVQVFLAVSLSAGITTMIGQLQASVEAVPVVLARNLPRASNYFFSYVTIYTFTTVTQMFLQLNGIIQLIVLSPLLDRSARQMWLRGTELDLQRWGTFIPPLTNVACIGLVYSIVAPLILLFCLLGFGTLWVAYRSYPPRLTQSDLVTIGSFYPTAIRQLLTGVYFMELCLAGLFFLVRDTENRPSCTAQAVIMLGVTALTAIFHFTLSNAHRWPCYLKRGKASVAAGEAKAAPEADDALTSACPILWVPKDDLGVSADEIWHARKSGVIVSDSGAYLEQGRVRLCGPPPALPKTRWGTHPM